MGFLRHTNPPILHRPHSRHERDHESDSNTEFMHSFGTKREPQFWSADEARDAFNAEFFGWFSPVSLSGIKELWVGQRAKSLFEANLPWMQTVPGVHGAFGVLTKVEDLTIVSCQVGPILRPSEQWREIPLPFPD